MTHDVEETALATGGAELSGRAIAAGRAMDERRDVDDGNV
jgi:hypothetical protein